MKEKNTEVMNEWQKRFPEEKLAFDGPYVHQEKISYFVAQKMAPDQLAYCFL